MSGGIFIEMRFNLVISWKGRRGSLEELRKRAGNVFWWQWKNGTNKHYCQSSKNGLNLELLSFLIAGKRIATLRLMVMNTEQLITQGNLSTKTVTIPIKLKVIGGMQSANYLSLAFESIFSRHIWRNLFGGTCTAMKTYLEYF